MRKPILFLILVFALAFPVASQTLAKIESELVGHFERLKKASNYTGSRDYDVLAKENQAIRNALVKYGERADVLKFPFTKLRKYLFLNTSKDGNLRTYSWDGEEGGTMHDYYNVYQFRDKSGKAHSWAEPFSQSLEDRGAGAFIHDIFQANTPSGTVYFAISTFIGSTSLRSQSINALKIEGEKLDRSAKVIKTRSGITSSINFEYDFFSVVDRPGRPIRLFSYDDAKKAFRFPVVINDRKTPQGRVTSKSITYQFDGKYFVRTGS
ncbi:MAG: hypothetical protein QM785_20235 [Pyrinomonadaceae bacterium]